MSSPGRTPSVSEYGHVGSASSDGGRGSLSLRSWLLARIDTWQLRQWLVVEVLIGVLEFHDIAMEDGSMARIARYLVFDTPIGRLQRRTQRGRKRVPKRFKRLPINTKQKPHSMLVNWLTLRE